MGVWRNKGDDGQSVIVGIRGNGSLWQLLYDFLQAYKDRTEALKGTPPIGETSIAQKLDAIIAMLQPLGSVPAELGLAKSELETIHGLIFDLVNPPSQPKPLEVTFVFKVKNDHQDESFSISVGGVTDAEGEKLPDTSGLTVEVTSSDDAVVGVTFDSSTNSGVAHFGHSGVASLTASVKNAAGDILGSGAADFTVTTGDPAAVSDVKLAFGGITEEPEA